ncbi:hypothetical protein CA54_22110 [Symmachiella macrocystis]|uniref:Uncharacterized protein n=1 Tax=Symmachiella macrocystis TaxID=2527985 RepID=A0A5C6BQ78_9PLAN|nr:hypothetical protein [Symmachiella macrocystis]TWU13376.1 hypothetical protein CA54_22110 [Symmachiella macrocystis]
MNTTDDYADVISKTIGMVRDEATQRLAQKNGLHVLDVTWEDTARFDNSAVGPNISDMTIQVQHKIAGSDEFELSCMPVIRYPNFSDLSADISPDEFYLLVGNEKEQPLEKITLRELLRNLRTYLTDSKSWKGDGKSLLADDRDSHVLVSSQACFLPIPKDGIAEFNPVLFNYQSRAGDPAVLTILATREGTSVTVIDNTRDGFEAGETWGQRLFFNQNGERASLTGQRKSDFLAATDDIATGESTEAPSPEDREGLNLVLLIQVPLKQKEPMQFDTMPVGFAGGDTGILMYCDAGLSDVEEAVIGHGKVEGPFTEIDGLEIERDDTYPIRVTVQFYKATSNGVVSEQDMMDIAKQINKVYQQADYVGSLVVEGPTGRPTEYHGMHVEPPHWWEAFWQRHGENTGQTREQAIAMMRKLLGENWQEVSMEEAEQAIAQKKPHLKE